MTPTRRDLLVSTAPLLLGAAAAGCGPKRRPSSYTPLPAPAPAAPPPAPLPPEPTEGRLVTGHEAALGRPGSRIVEPLAPPGCWTQVAWWPGWAWVPDYLPASVLSLVLQEIAGTLARFEPDAVPLPFPAGPAPRTRVILVPGPAFAVGSFLASGLFALGLWEEADGTRSDVIWLGLTDAATRAAVPVGHPYRLYAPAAGHEFAHQRADPAGLVHKH